MMIEDDDLFRRCIAQRLSNVEENQTREARREAKRTDREGRARLREEGIVQEVDMSQEASIPVQDVTSSVHSQLSWRGLT